MNTYWEKFAKAGNPNRKDLPVWPATSLKYNGLTYTSLKSQMGFATCRHEDGF